MGLGLSSFIVKRPQEYTILLSKQKDQQKLSVIPRRVQKGFHKEGRERKEHEGKS